MEKRQLRIDVLGTSFVIQSDESPEHLARLSSYVKAKIEEVRSRYSFADPLTVAVLAATVGLVSVAGLSEFTVPLALAPTIVSKAALKAKLVSGAATVKVSCSPAVKPGQTVALIVGERLVVGAPAPPGSPDRKQLSFDLTNFSAGTYTLRLRIDGADSIPVAAPVTPVNPDDPATMTVDPTQTLVLQ